MRRFAAALVVLLAALPASADDQAAAAKKARDELCVLLVDLANEARTRGDVTAAQAIAETVSFIAGVPHPHLDAMRRELVRDVATEKPWAFHAFEHWQPIHDRVWILLGSAREKDRTDGALIEGLRRATSATRALNKIRVAAGLKALRYDGKRSAKNFAFARTRTLPPAPAQGPLRYFMFLDLAATMHQALADVRFRAAFFDPADKGLTLASVKPEDGMRVSVIGMSGNTRVFPRMPRCVTYPPPGDVHVPLIQLPRKGENTPRAVPLSVHFFQPFPDLVGAKATLGGTSCEVTVQDIGDQRVATFLPPRSLHRAGRFTAQLLSRDGASLAKWSFTVRRP